MRTDLQENLPPSHVERGIEAVIPVLQIAREKPLLEMLTGFVESLRRGEDVNVHEYCCGMGVAAEQIQLLLNALCIAAGIRARAAVVGSDINPLHKDRLYPSLEEYHCIAFDYLRSWDLPEVDVDILEMEPELQRPQARFISSSADQRIEHPGPLDFAFCIHGIWYVDDKLGNIFHTVEALRKESGLAIWDALDLSSIKITHLKDGVWQGAYKLRNFLEDHGQHDFKFHLEPHARTYTLSARREHVTAGLRPRFIRAVEANAPSPVSLPCWDYASFRRAAEYEFEE